MSSKSADGEWAPGTPPVPRERLAGVEGIPSECLLLFRVIMLETFFMFAPATEIQGGGEVRVWGPLVREVKATSGGFVDVTS